MKPSIVRWVYVGLIYLLLDKILDAITPYLFTLPTDNCFVQPPCIANVLTAILTTIALVGVVRKALWARTISIIAICAGVTSDLVFIVNPILVSKVEIDVWRYIPPISLIDIPLLAFLIYKILSTDSFNYYPERSQ
jgi:uncharacterized membrane protein